MKFLLCCGQVESESSCVRIGGTSIGGGTFWGLGSLLTKAKVGFIFVRSRDLFYHGQLDGLFGL